MSRIISASKDLLEFNVMGPRTRTASLTEPRLHLGLLERLIEGRNEDGELHSRPKKEMHTEIAQQSPGVSDQMELNGCTRIWGSRTPFEMIRNEQGKRDGEIAGGGVNGSNSDMVPNDGLKMEGQLLDDGESCAESLILRMTAGSLNLDKHARNNVVHGLLAEEAAAGAVALVEGILQERVSLPRADLLSHLNNKKTQGMEDENEEDLEDDVDTAEDEISKNVDSPGLADMKDTSLLSKLEPHKLKRKRQCPDVPLCRLRSTQIVRPILKQEDVLEVASRFASSGYNREAWPFWVSLLGEDLKEADKGDQWDECWAKVDAIFQEELKQDADWSFLQGKTLWVWDGNHRLQGWLDVIKTTHPNDLDWHVRVKVEVLDVNESNRIQILQAAHGLNEIIGTGHVQTNALHEIYYVQKVGLGPLEHYASRLSAKDLQECQKKLPPEQGGTWYCLTLNSLIDILAANDIIAESHKAGLRYDKSTPANLQTEDGRVEIVKKAVATVRKKTGSRLLKLLPVADPRLGDEWLQAIKEGAGKGILKGGGKCNYKLGSEKLYHIAVAKVPAHAKTEWVRLGTGVEAERLRRGYPKEVPTEIDFIEWVGKETWWWQVEDQAARLVSEFEKQEVGPLLQTTVGEITAEPLGKWLKYWKCKYYKNLFVEQLKRADKKASLNQQAGGAQAAKRIAFRYVKSLLDRGFAKSEPVGLAEFRSDDEELTMYDEIQCRKMSIWEAENCPWWLDMSGPPEEEKQLYEDLKAGRLSVAHNERTQEEKEVAVQAAKEAAAKAEARRMQELGPVKNLKRKAQRRKRDLYEKVDVFHVVQTDVTQARRRKKSGRVVKVEEYVSREGGEIVPAEGSEELRQCANEASPLSPYRARRLEPTRHGLHAPCKLPGKYVLAEVVCALVDYVELSTRLEQHQRVKAARIQAELTSRGKGPGSHSTEVGRELPLPATWFELVDFLTRNSGGRMPKCGGVQRNWAAELVVCDIPTGQPVPGCSSDQLAVPSWNGCSPEHIPRCIQLARAILSDDGCLVMVAQSTVDTCVEIHRHVQSNKMRILKTWVVIQEQSLTYEQRQEKKTCMVHCIIRKDCRFDFRQLVRPIDPEFDPVTMDILRSFVPVWDLTKRRQKEGEPQYLWHGGREKAQSMWQQLIECCSGEGDRVVDFTAGTGGTMVAAEISGRHLYAMEREEELLQEVLVHLQRRPQEMLPGPSSPSSGSEVSRPYVLDPSV